jgi:hypothetical protein
MLAGAGRLEAGRELDEIISANGEIPLNLQ